MRRSFLFVVLLIALLSASPGRLSAQQAEAPAGGAAEELLGLWSRLAKLVIDVAEQFPEEKYNYEPTPEVRSFSKQLLHIAGANYFFLGQAGAEKTQPEHSSRETKADVVAVVKESFADGAEAIRQAGDEGLQEIVKHPFADQMVSVRTIWATAMGHGAEHYGQLVVYYRLNGLVPPASRQSGN